MGLPSTVAYNCIDMLYEEEALLAKSAADAKQLSEEMLTLYGYPRFNDMFLDVAELYLSMASAELQDIKKTVASLNPAGGKKLDSLLNLHHARFQHWMQYSAIKKEEEDAYGVRSAKLDEGLKLATSSLDGLEKKARSGSKKDR